MKTKLYYITKNIFGFSRASCGGETHVTIHFQTAPVVHSLLLLLQLPHLLTNRIALWNGAICILTFLRMNSE
jgi:hypothetical protein